VIERTLLAPLRSAAATYPVVTLTGPRQSGKTTLCRMAFTDARYVSLENPAQREFAVQDPQGFLGRLPGCSVIDEVQRAPELLSWVQGIVDADPRPGRFVVTGSQSFGLLQTVSQSLAGRTALLELLPLGLDEVRRFGEPARGVFDTLVTGGYPRIHDRRLPAQEWLADYVATYVERDVRQVLKVGDLLVFQTFLRLCAGRTGQLLNLSSLAADCGISHSTARSWLSVLEASFIAFRLHRTTATSASGSPRRPSCTSSTRAWSAACSASSDRSSSRSILCAARCSSPGPSPRSSSGTATEVAGRGCTSTGIAAGSRSTSWSRAGPR
jgi:predicted AAA+ superfamily ATPase